MKRLVFVEEDEASPEEGESSQCERVLASLVTKVDKIRDEMRVILAKLDTKTVEGVTMVGESVTMAEEGHLPMGEVGEGEITRVKDGDDNETAHVVGSDLAWLDGGWVLLS